MKQTIILLAGILALSLTGLIAVGTTIEKRSLNSSFYILEKDPGLNIEEWMIDGKYWEASGIEINSIAEENDEELNMEAWMVEDSYWN